MSWKAPITAGAIALVAVVGLLWWGAIKLLAGRDAWWRGEIARASAAVQAEVARKGEAVLLNDAELIATLEGESAKRRNAEARLAAAQKQLRDSAGQCPRVPAHCLRQ